MFIVGSYIATPHIPVYGVEWYGVYGPSTTVGIRTDDSVGFTEPNPVVDNGNGSSPFDTIMPWAGMRIVEDANAGTLVEIPKYYYKWTRNGDAMKLQITNSPAKGFRVSPAHADRGDGVGERDYVYVGRYHCASDYKSKTGVKPASSYTRAKFRTSIHTLGTTIWQWDYAMFWTIAMLYLVEFADWNSQAKIGYGCGNNSGTENMGSTDDMTYHTGTMQESRITYGLGTQYRHIEDMWGNVFDFVDGIYFGGTNNVDIYCIKNPSNFSDITGGAKVGTRLTIAADIQRWGESLLSSFDYARYPDKADVNVGTYDACAYNANGVVLRIGGYYMNGQAYGLFCFDGTSSASFSHAGVGSRLMVLPPSRLAA